MQRIVNGAKALRELGVGQVGLFAVYRVLLCSGWLRYATYRSLRRAHRSSAGSGRTLPPLRDLLELPGREALQTWLGAQGARALIEEADEIVEGKVRLFGGPACQLQLAPVGPLLEWDRAEMAAQPVQTVSPEDGDIKFVWEPARFGWAFTLGRAYLLSGDDRYPQVFWERWEQFMAANPAYRGPNWASAQEVALRILACVFAAQVFKISTQTTASRSASLAEAIMVHAARIPATMLYARAQNNNHLLSEAAGLYTAGLALPTHPLAGMWRETGWRWFHHGLQTQIAQDGTYSQHSTGYHRLMLHLALWVRMLAQGEGRAFPQASQQRLDAAARWLLALVDAHQGQTSAIGPQDGAYILPLACGGQADYRPVAQAACQAFCGLRPFPDGSWDEMSAWLGVPLAAVQNSNISASAGNGVLHMPGQDSWAYLRAVNFHSRPGHADQLHLDLWWRGLNLALDPGSYLYNAAPPWDNSLARTAAHNTLQVAGREQMTWAGRFLWLDRAQGRYTGFEQTPDGRMVRLVAEHDGYRSLGVTFRRAVTASSDGCWRVEDSLPRSNRAQADENVACSLHWLLPDWEWDLQGPDRIVHLTLQSPLGPVSLKIWLAGDDLAEQIQGALRPSLYRGGEQIYGDGPDGVTRGWFAPTYGVKLPALSLVVPIAMTAQLTLISEWQLPAG